MKRLPPRLDEGRFTLMNGPFYQHRKGPAGRIAPRR
jgi:hypothetical protein